MRKVANLSGRVFGRLTVNSRAGSNTFHKATWNCLCACGKECVVVGSAMVAGKAVSCGCYRVSGEGRVTHGARRKGVSSRAYSTWCNMKSRCDDPNTPQYKDYGGRGITYCAAWADFSAFLVDMGEPEPDMTLDRKDNDPGYSPENCRWADRITQRRNSRSHMVWVELDGERLILTDAVRKAKVVSYRTAVSRIHGGWSPLDAVLTPYTRPDNKGYRL